MAIRPFPPTQLAKYPHLSPADQAIWHPFIAENPLGFETVAYDVHVGEGADLADIELNSFAQDFKLLTQKRIDAVGYTTSTIYIIEIKPTASIIALGQAIVYTQMYRRTYRPSAALQPTILTNHADRDIKLAAQSNNVLILYPT